MGTAEANFKNWFVNSLEPLREDPSAGFIFALVAFPLLERYLRRKFGCKEGHNLRDQPDLTHLGMVFPELLGREREFWNCYRNGLLHHVAFPKAKRNQNTGAWGALPPSGFSGHAESPIYFNKELGGFVLSPVAFFDAVKDMILADFAVFAGDNLFTQYPWPSVYNPGAVQPGIVPTISGVYVVKRNTSGGGS